MSPTYTMSAHLCRQIYTSWRQTRQPSQDAPSNPLPSPTAVFQRAASPEKRSMDSDRSGSPTPSPAMSRSTSNSNSNWTWGGR